MIMMMKKNLVDKVHLNFRVYLMSLNDGGTKILILALSLSLKTQLLVRNQSRKGRGLFFLNLVSETI